jgi:hypothetical protein
LALQNSFFDPLLLPCVDYASLLQSDEQVHPGTHCQPIMNSVLLLPGFDFCKLSQVDGSRAAIAPAMELPGNSPVKWFLASVARHRRFPPVRRFHFNVSPQ